MDSVAIFLCRDFFEQNYIGPKAGTCCVYVHRLQELMSVVSGHDRLFVGSWYHLIRLDANNLSHNVSLNVHNAFNNVSPLGGSWQPWNMVVDAERKLGYVVQPYATHLLVVDLSAMAVIGAFPYTTTADSGQFPGAYPLNYDARRRTLWYEQSTLTTLCYTQKQAEWHPC